MNLLASQRVRRLAITGLVSGTLGVALAWGAVSRIQQQPDRRLVTFRLRSEVPLGAENGNRLLEEMAQLRRDVVTMLELPESGPPISLNLFRSRQSYLQSLLPDVPEAADRSALYVERNQTHEIYVYHRSKVEVDLRHECTHAVLHQSLSRIPLWLDEGLAEYFEQPAEQRSRSHPYLEELKAELAAGWRPDLRRLERLQTLRDLQAEDYRECWGWTHWLLHGSPETRMILKDYLQTLRTSESAGPLSDRLQDALPDMDVQLIHHLQSW